MFITFVGAGAVGAGAVSFFGSGSDQKILLRLRFRNTAYKYGVKTEQLDQMFLQGNFLLAV
jgi:hypothetical protein